MTAALAAVMSAPAEGQRAAGSRASPRARTASSPTSTSGRSADGAGACASSRAVSDATSDSRRNGGSPVRHSNSTAASDQTSLRASSALAPGLLRADVVRRAQDLTGPGETPAVGGRGEPEVSKIGVVGTPRAGPAPARMFPGLTSRWRMPWAWAASRAAAIPARSATARSGGSGPSRRRSSRRSGPSARRIAIHRVPPSSPASYTGRTFGWSSDAAARASARKRVRTRSSSPSQGGSTLTAALRPRRSSLAL